MNYKELITIINNKNARKDEVDDAIIELGMYREKEVIDFLFILLERNLDDEILSSIGESIGQILSADKNLYNAYKYRVNDLPRFIKNEVISIIDN